MYLFTVRRREKWSLPSHTMEAAALTLNCLWEKKKKKKPALNKAWCNNVNCDFWREK